MDHYGVHLAPDGLYWLVQENGGQNARGLSIKCPFVVRPKPRVGCPHRLSLNSRTSGAVDLSFVNAIAGNALTRAFLPIPQEPKAFFVEENSHVVSDVLFKLLDLSGAGLSSITDPMFMTPKDMLHRAGCSNIAPFVVTGMSVKWMAKSGELLNAFRNSRTLIISGDPDCVLPSWIERVSNRDLLQMAPQLSETRSSRLRGDGEAALTQWMRQEWHFPSNSN